MAVVAQLVRALDCGSRCRGFESRRSPHFFPSTTHDIEMTFFEALFLGIVQGLTEFLPVSSSAHLILFQRLFGLQNPEQYLFFDVVCHLGTLAVIPFYFRKNLANLLFSSRQPLKPIGLVAVATFMLIPIALFHGPIRELFKLPYLIPFGFFTTSLLLFFLSKKRSENEKPLSWKDASLVGMAQAISVLPGISRSGATISFARFLGWKTEDAVCFSFLIAIPAISGAAFLEALKAFKTGNAFQDMGMAHYAIGFFTSFGIGFLALKCLSYIASRYRWKWFSLYCFFAGVIALWAGL